MDPILVIMTFVCIAMLLMLMVAVDWFYSELEVIEELCDEDDEVIDEVVEYQIDGVWYSF